jgi:hypothetical protein
MPALFRRLIIYALRDLCEHAANMNRTPMASGRILRLSILLAIT